MPARPYVLIGLLALLACSDSLSPTSQPLTISMDKVGGDRQTATVANQLGDPVVVEVKVGPTAVSGIVVNFVALQGEVWAGTAMTDTDGRASDYWTLGTTAGEQRLEVRATNAAGDRIVYDTFFATATPGPVVQLILSTQDTTLFEGEKFAVIPTLEAWDGYGNVVTDFNVSLTAESPFHISADTVWAEDEVKDFIGLRSGNVDSTIYIGVVHDLSQYTWTGEFTCYDNPIAMRGAENPPIGIDSMRSNFTVDEVSYGERDRFGLARLYMSGPATLELWWKDGVYTQNGTVFSQYFLQAPPDSLAFHSQQCVWWDIASCGAVGIKAASSPPAYQFPVLCNQVYQGGGTALRLTAH